MDNKELSFPEHNILQIVGVSGKTVCGDNSEKKNLII